MYIGCEPGLSEGQRDMGRDKWKPGATIEYCKFFLYYYSFLNSSHASLEFYKITVLLAKYHNKLESGNTGIILCSLSTMYYGL